MATVTTDNANEMEKGQAGGFQLTDSSMSASRSSSWYTVLKGPLRLFSTSTLGVEGSDKSSALRRLWHRIIVNVAQQQGKAVRGPVIIQKCKCLPTIFNEL